MSWRRSKYSFWQREEEEDRNWILSESRMENEIMLDRYKSRHFRCWELRPTGTKRDTNRRVNLETKLPDQIMHTNLYIRKRPKEFAAFGDSLVGVWSSYRKVATTLSRHDSNPLSPNREDPCRQQIASKTSFAWEPARIYKLLPKSTPFLEFGFYYWPRFRRDRRTLIMTVWREIPRGYSITSSVPFWSRLPIHSSECMYAHYKEKGVCFTSNPHTRIDREEEFVVLIWRRIVVNRGKSGSISAYYFWSIFHFGDASCETQLPLRSLNFRFGVPTKRIEQWNELKHELSCQMSIRFLSLKSRYLFWY